MAKDTGVWVIALALGLWALAQRGAPPTPVPPPPEVPTTPTPVPPPPEVPTTPEADISLTIK